MLILNEGQAIEDLDTWPGDVVFLHDSLIHLGTVNEDGQFVSELETLH